MREELRPVDLPEALQRSIESNLIRESARIAEVLAAPVIEAPTVSPAQDSVDTERLLRTDVAPAMQIARPTMPLPAPVIMPEAGNIIESFQLPIAVPAQTEFAQKELAEQSSPAQGDVVDSLELNPELSTELKKNEPELIKEELQLAEGEVIQQKSEPAPAGEDERRVAPDRIPRPELPPFQRIRPAVDRISISTPRPQPMRI
jgi:hypothetical protein